MFLRNICSTLISLIDKAAWQVKLRAKNRPKDNANRIRHYVYTFQFSRDRTAVEFKNRRQLREENITGKGTFLKLMINRIILYTRMSALVQTI